MSETPSTPRAKTLKAQKAVNLITGALMHTPLVSKVIGRRLVTVYVIGRKTGRQFTVPLAYTRDGDDLLIGSPFGWVRNLRTGEPVEILLKGRRRTADVIVYRTKEDVVPLYGQMCRDNPAFAKFNQVARDTSGEPDQADLVAAWQGGARAVRLTPRPR